MLLMLAQWLSQDLHIRGFNVFGLHHSACRPGCDDLADHLLRRWPRRHSLVDGEENRSGGTSTTDHRLTLSNQVHRPWAVR